MSPLKYIQASQSSI
jgi:hypothetical protein